MYLVFIRSELAVTGLLRERLGLGGYGGQALVSGILDDRCYETRRGGNGNRDIRILVSKRK